MPSTNETKVTTNELNSDGKDATETQERHWDFLHGCWKYGPRKFNGWDFRYRGQLRYGVSINKRSRSDSVLDVWL